KDTPFDEVIQYLSDAMGQPILIDKSDLADVELKSDTLVTLVTPGKGLSTRTVLRKLLNEFSLTYVIQEGQIRVVTQKKADEMMTTQVYPIGDLVRGTGTFGNGVVWGPYLEQAQANENAQAIVDTIEKTINPSSWRSGGGEGSITFHWPSMSLIV